MLLPAKLFHLNLVNSMDVKYYRKCKNVDRLSTSFKHRQYNLLEHQYMVAVLFKKFAELEKLDYGLKQFDIILHHDILESLTTDLIFTVKNLNKITKRAWEIIEEEVIKVNPKFEKYSDEAIKDGLNKKQFSLFKICDYLDLWVFCKEEEALGNKTKPIKKVIEKCEELITKISLENEFTHPIKFIKEYEV